LTLQELGDRSGVSASTIHKIENYKTVPTVSVVLKLTHGLGRRPSELLAEVDAAEQVAIVRDGDREKLVIEGRARLEQLGETIPRNRLDAWRIQTQPGINVGRNGETSQYVGEILLLVEEGELEIEIDHNVYKVEAGDSVHFDTSLPHRWWASGNLPATALILFLIPERPAGDVMNRIATAFGNRETIPAVSGSG
jgi:transcriptional regulator with XRE-family HTH domain